MGEPEEIGDIGPGGQTRLDYVVRISVTWEP